MLRLSVKLGFYEHGMDCRKKRGAAMSTKRRVLTICIILWWTAEAWADLSYVSSSTYQTASGTETSSTIKPPSSVSQNNLLIAYVSSYSGGANAALSITA